MKRNELSWPVAVGVLAVSLLVAYISGIEINPNTFLAIVAACVFTEIACQRTFTK